MITAHQYVGCSKKKKKSKKEKKEKKEKKRKREEQSGEGRAAESDDDDIPSLQVGKGRLISSGKKDFQLTNLLRSLLLRRHNRNRHRRNGLSAMSPRRGCNYRATPNHIQRRDTHRENGTG